MTYFKFSWFRNCCICSNISRLKDFNQLCSSSLIANLDGLFDPISGAPLPGHLFSGPTVLPVEGLATTVSTATGTGSGRKVKNKLKSNAAALAAASAYASSNIISGPGQNGGSVGHGIASGLSDTTGLPVCIPFAGHTNQHALLLARFRGYHFFEIT
ncbi:unnamed protein product [Protopolystoma xenopodis]|uniref:Uncharacterized protein n=1 Tax=Protopolystoma xenopodis TaxID=117903 RepID=A0A448WCX3_9PLAT|nr:unnamed protein product [Protopolystoma xenopodis]